MARAHRSRVTVDVPGHPAIYLLVAGLPSGWNVVGTVTTADRTGALVRNQRTGAYCQAVDGSIRSLPQRKVEAALAAVGRGT